MPEIAVTSKTFLFTDIEGSTRLFQVNPEAMRSALFRHDAIIRDAVQRHGGRVYRTAGDGLCAVFDDPAPAFSAAVAAQIALQKEPWPPHMVLRTRMALAEGSVEELDNDFFGLAPTICARILSVGHGGQVLVPTSLRDAVTAQTQDGVEFRELGERRLKDLIQPVHIFQVTHRDLRSEFPPLKAIERIPNNLPAPSNSFIGRQSEMSELLRLLRGAVPRLVTITGPGGCGKSRLALETGRALLDDFTDGVFFVSLAPLLDAAGILPEIARTFGIREEQGMALANAIKEHLSQKHLLLILDNFEHLIGGTPTVSELLNSCPNLKILATSREELNFVAEHHFDLQPLPAPDSPKTPAEALASAPAVELFLDRAKAASSGFTPESSDIAEIAKACMLLDGLPLAIELTAARIRTYSPVEILHNLESRLAFVSDGPADLPTRHRSLRAALDWSFDALPDPEKALFARLSVFAGGFSREAAAAVCNMEDSRSETIEQGLASLLRKSLVQRTIAPTGDSRFSMLQSIREYALEKSDARGESEILARRHAEFFSGFARSNDQYLIGPGRPLWMERFRLEDSNFVAALTWTSQYDTALGLALANSLGKYWNLATEWTAARAWLGLLFPTSSSANPAIRLEALTWSGMFASHQSDYKEARSYLEEALTLSKQIGDESRQAKVLVNLALTCSIEGDYAKARVLFERALGIERKLGVQFRIAQALNNLGTLTSDQGDFEAGSKYLEEALSLAKDTGDRRTIAMTTNNLGLLAERSGSLERAERCYEECLRIALELGERRGIAYIEGNLGSLRRKQKEYDAALSCCKKSLELLREVGDRQGCCTCVEQIAYIELDRGNVAKAARLMSCARAVRQKLVAARAPVEKAQHDDAISRAMATLTESGFLQCWEEGAVMPFEQVLDYAVDMS